MPSAVHRYHLHRRACTRRPPTGNYEWLYALSGRLRLILADHDLIMGAGEAAEFDTRLPHWFGSTGQNPVEILSLFGKQGERMHIRAKPRAPDHRRNR